MANNYKIVTFVPASHADAIRTAMGEAGAGRIGNYTLCSFTIQGVGRFKPGSGAHPAIGTVGALESVDEERIEVVASAAAVKNVLAAIRRAHPYEEPAIDVYPLEDF